MENKEADADVNALETPESATSFTVEKTETKTKVKRSPAQRLRDLITHLNVYLLLFMLILVLSGGIVFIGIQRNKKASTDTSINNQPLTTEALAKLKGTDTKVGDAKQTLNIESNAVFAGKVLLRNDLDVAGTIKVGGALNLPGITVAGNSSFDQIQGNKLSVSGDGNIQGQLTVHKNLTVSAGASFGGPISAPSITVQTFNLVGDLQFNRHIDAGGSTPGQTYGGALGSGGTVSVSGTDTAGTITINTGGSPPAGCFVTVSFAASYNNTPHVVVSPVGDVAADLNYYVTRTTTSFNLCTTNAAPASRTLVFDYIALD